MNKKFIAIPAIALAAGGLGLAAGLGLTATFASAATTPPPPPAPLPVSNMVHIQSNALYGVPFTGSVWAPASTHFTVTLRNDSEKPTWVGSYNTGYRLSWAPVAVTAALMVSDAPSTLPTYTTISPSSIYIPAGGTATATVSIQIPKGAHVGPYPVGVSATVPNGEFDGPPANAGFYVFGSN
jgi:hypothetical protein